MRCPPYTYVKFIVITPPKALEISTVPMVVLLQWPESRKCFVFEQTALKTVRGVHMKLAVSGGQSIQKYEILIFHYQGASQKPTNVEVPFLYPNSALAETDAIPSAYCVIFCHCICVRRSMYHFTVLLVIKSHESLVTYKSTTRIPSYYFEKRNKGDVFRLLLHSHNHCTAENQALQGTRRPDQKRLELFMRPG